MYEKNKKKVHKFIRKREIRLQFSHQHNLLLNIIMYVSGALSRQTFYKHICQQRANCKLQTSTVKVDTRKDNKKEKRVKYEEMQK